MEWLTGAKARSFFGDAFGTTKRHALLQSTQRFGFDPAPHAGLQLLVIRVLIVDGQLLAHAFDCGVDDVTETVRELAEFGGDVDCVFLIAQVGLDLYAYRRMGLIVNHHRNGIAGLQIILYHEIGDAIA